MPNVELAVKRSPDGFNSAGGYYIGSLGFVHFNRTISNLDSCKQTGDSLRLFDCARYLDFQKAENAVNFPLEVLIAHLSK